jgi:hypothetical protein
MNFINKHIHFIKVLVVALILTLIFIKQICNLLLKIGENVDYTSSAFKFGYCLIILISMIYFASSFFKGYVPNIKMNFLIVYIFFVYLFLRLIFTTHLSFVVLGDSFNYSDIIFFISFLHFINLSFLELNYYLIKKEDKQNNFFFLEDNVYADGEIDNEKILKKLIDVLINFKPDVAFIIGINAVWGYGKSSFLHRFKNQYEKNNTHGIIFWNRIWKNKGSVAIIENFFEELKDNLKPYSGEISEDISKYVDSILNLSSSDLKKIVNIGKEALSGNETLEKFYDNINNNIKRIDRQIVILLDDLDRLEKPEILNTLKLIRTLSDFNNVIFIAGYDRKYIVDTIEMPKDNYLDKIFNVEINLLPFDEQLIVDELLRQVDLSFPLLTGETDQLGFNNAFKNLFTKRQINLADINIEAFTDNNFQCTNYTLKYQDFLKTYRDVKRFINEFKFNASFLDSEFDVVAEEYILLKLLTYKYRDLQNNIFTSIKEIFSNGIIDNANIVVQHFGGNSNNIFIYDKDAQERVFKIIESFKDEDKNIINATLCFLFGKKTVSFYQKRQNSISKSYYTDIYIKNNIVGGQISITQLQSAFEKNELFKIAKELSDSTKQYKFQITNELKQFIFINKFSTIEQFKDILTTLNFIMLHVDNQNDNQLVAGLISTGYNLFYEKDKDAFLRDLQNIISNSFLGYLDNLFSSININIKRRESVAKYSAGVIKYRKNILDSKDLKFLLVDKLKRAIDSQKKTELICSIYNLHVEIIVAEKRILRSQEANRIVKIDIENRLYDYLSSPIFVSISEPIEGNLEEFSEYKPHFLLSHIFSNPETLDLLIENPEKVELFEQFEKEGWGNFKKFLRNAYSNDLYEGKIDAETIKKMIDFVNFYIRNNFESLSKTQYDKIWGEDLPF